ncbi:MAG: hypothetical protein LKH78_05265 [Weizmannia coagulans]|nr:hypothetical protein [Heyndrickxia coagulans]
MAAKKKKILTSLLEPAIFVEGWKNHRLRGIPRILLRRFFSCFNINSKINLSMRNIKLLTKYGEFT